MRVSVLLACWNAESYVGEAVELVLGQRPAPHEIIAVDDGSTDRSAAVLERFGPRLVLIRQANSGVGAALNRAAARGTGEALAFIDADDLWAPGKVARQTQALSSDPELDAVFGFMETFASPDLPEDERSRLTVPERAEPAFTKNGILIRTAAFNRLGGFDPERRNADFFDWYARAVGAGIPMAPGVGHRLPPPHSRAEHGTVGSRPAAQRLSHHDEGVSGRAAKAPRGRVVNGLPLPDRARWLLEACLRDDSRAVESFGKWRRFANPDRMEGRELRLTPLLHANMTRLGFSDQKLAWIGGQAKHIWLTGMLRRRELMPVLDMLEGGRIDFALIKGAALLARFPKAVGARPMGDFDLLIDRSSARAALAILNASGLRGVIGSAFSDADLNRFHAVGLSSPSGTCVDLHWRPAASIASPRHAEGVRERAVAASLEGRPVLVASATDHLFILLCHAFHDDLERRNEWIADVDLLFRLIAPRSGTGRCFIGWRARTNSIAG